MTLETPFSHFAVRMDTLCQAPILSDRQGTTAAPSRKISAAVSLLHLDAIPVNPITSN
jgi:hypothetical protein